MLKKTKRTAGRFPVANPFTTSETDEIVHDEHVKQQRRSAQAAALIKQATVSRVERHGGSLQLGNRYGDVTVIFDDTGMSGQIEAMFALEDTTIIARPYDTKMLIVATSDSWMFSSLATVTDISPR